MYILIIVKTIQLYTCCKVLSNLLIKLAVVQYLFLSLNHWLIFVITISIEVHVKYKIFLYIYTYSSGWWCFKHLCSHSNSLKRLLVIEQCRQKDFTVVCKRKSMLFLNWQKVIFILYSHYSFIVLPDNN